MNRLEEKYISNRLSTDELGLLRQEIGRQTDEQMAARMEVRWNEAVIDTSRVPADRITQLRQTIGQQAGIGQRSTYVLRAWRYLQVAAVIMLPLLLGVSFYFYRQQAALNTDPILVATAEGERATVTLPDGTHVTLNELSQLSYDAHTFNNTLRHLQFDGEAYFDVAKDADHPFTISADGLRVSVLGTKFNLLARTTQPHASLTLEEGCVQLAAAGGETATLSPSQRATLDKQSGRIVVETLTENLQDATAWARKEFVFRNAPLSTVVATLEKAYGLTFDTGDATRLLGDRFTGTMSSTNLNEDLEIIEKSYHLEATLIENHVTLKAK